jgi:arylamine N-acetyltransferase
VPEHGPQLGDDIKAAYLRRLGADAEPPSAAALQRLVQQHAERVPYETMWIASGEGWSIDPLDAAARIALQSRGGYCYHLNGALSELLRALGYAVRRHVGGVHGPDGPSAESVGNHLVLTVDGLATTANPTGTWYVDAGLGDALYAPVPLAPGPFEQAPFRLSLEEVPGGWHLTHDPSGGFSGMTWTSGDARPVDFAEQHEWLSTAPDSGFVRVPMAERRDAAGVDVVRGLVVSRVGSGARTGEPITRRAEWFSMLGDLFDLRFEHSSPAALERLWQRVVATHEEWERAQRQ